MTATDTTAISARTTAMIGPQVDMDVMLSLPHGRGISRLFQTAVLPQGFSQYELDLCIEAAQIVIRPTRHGSQDIFVNT